MENRKESHIKLTFDSRVKTKEADKRFYYEPLLSSHKKSEIKKISFNGKEISMPVWISSMTGGSSKAREMNKNLAKICSEFKMGMGLGSCRIALENHEHFEDFNIRKYIGEQPFYTNIGVAQIEKMLKNKSCDKIAQLISKLNADGLIIHVNPLQEAFQKEGDSFYHPPIETITEFSKKYNISLIVKEVGQGMGPESLKALLKLPLEAIEFGALGGTNFTKLERLREKKGDNDFNCLANTGHTAEEMTFMVNKIVSDNLTAKDIKCKKVIISGGIESVTDGYYLINKSTLPAVMGLGATFLKYAEKDYNSLYNFASDLKKSLNLAYNFLKVKPE
ncbi:isopentenyl-diphosphate delta-isomerase [Marinilabiliaceae bacterium ANBcel2]|nr:isopentenyl-diphosphate delta-isomerase [Marinilabiliaceae bacterium ANBcel2]